jgi:hypothetical protein
LGQGTLKFLDLLLLRRKRILQGLQISGRHGYLTPFCSR